MKISDWASSRLLRRLAAALLLALAGWVVVESQRIFRADWSTQAARQQVQRWLAGVTPTVDTDAWAAADAALRGGLQLTPNDPGLHEALGDLHAVAGVRDWAVSSLRKAHHNDAAAHYEAALALRPGSAMAWASLASARQAMEENQEKVHTAWRNALRLGPFEGHVQPVLLQVVLADWTGAAPEMREWAKSLFDEGDEHKRAQINALAKYYGLQFAPDPAVKGP